MTITNISGRKLTEKEIKTVRWYLDYLQPEWKYRMVLAVCDNGTIAFIDSEEAPDQETQLKEAHRIMTDSLSGSPDFNTYVYTDKTGEVTMNRGTLGKLIFNRPQEEADTAQMDFNTGYIVRMSMIHACESGNVIALAENDREWEAKI